MVFPKFYNPATQQWEELVVTESKDLHDSVSQVLPTQVIVSEVVINPPDESNSNNGGSETTQVNADWDAVDGVEKILNKPALGTAAGQNIEYFITADYWDTDLAGTQNTTAFTPTIAYHSATKQYVGNAIARFDLSL